MEENRLNKFLQQAEEQGEEGQDQEVPNIGNVLAALLAGRNQSIMAPKPDNVEALLTEREKHVFKTISSMGPSHSEYSIHRLEEECGLNMDELVHTLADLSVLGMITVIPPSEVEVQDKYSRVAMDIIHHRQGQTLDPNMQKVMLVDLMRIQVYRMVEGLCRGYMVRCPDEPRRLLASPDKYSDQEREDFGSFKWDEYLVKTKQNYQEDLERRKNLARNEA